MNLGAYTYCDDRQILSLTLFGRHVLEIGGDFYPLIALNENSISAPGAPLDYAYVIGRQVALGTFARECNYEYGHELGGATCRTITRLSPTHNAR